MIDKMTDITDLVSTDDGSYKDRKLISMKTNGNEEISVKNHEIGEQFCKVFVDNIINLKLPDYIRNKDELRNVIELHGKFETFSLQAMFKVVIRAMQMLENIDIDDIYDITGNVDLGKWNAQLMMQQQCMNLIAQFNLHLRQLPVAITNLIRDIEYSQTITVTEIQNDTKQIAGTTSSKSIAQLLREAGQELQRNDDNEDFMIQEEPPTPVESSILDSEENIEL